MAVDSRADFHKRLAMLDKKHPTEKRLRRSDRVGIYDYDEEKRRKRRRFPFRKLMIWVVFGIVGLIAVKAYVVQNMGEENYQQRITELRAGDQYEQLAGVLISRDPLMAFFEKALFSSDAGKTDDTETKNASETSPEALNEVASQ